MMNHDKVTTLMERIAEVSNIGKDIGIDLDDFCVDASRKVMTETVALDDEDVRMILKGYTNGPTGVQ
ncbi:MAG TPA: hypothetical protein VE957_18890 [Terriglobales bacterium]|jgi:hypothetical protein|nr:hypothetical protein [Terriglobales bacterium]